jgi:hypothetical protein
MRHGVWRGAAALAMGGGLVIASAVGAQAQTRPGHGGGGSNGVSIVADNLNNPRQIAVHDGAVYVAEAGTGGTDCAPGGPCLGFTGSVTRVAWGHVQRVQTGLLSVQDPEDPGSAVGMDALTFMQGRLFGIVTGSCDLTGAPDAALAQAGKVLWLQGGTKFKAVGDASGIECQTDPDGQGADTDPYGIAARGRTFYVADAAGNDVVKIKRANTTVAAVISKSEQPVPTSLAFGPDGGLYIGTLNFEGGPGQAKVYRLDVRTGALSVYADGLTAVTSLAFDTSGRLFVTEWTTGFGPDGPSPDGDVVVIPRGGGHDGRQVLGTGALHFPTGVGVTRQGVYVSNWGIAPGVDTVYGPGNHGQLVRLAPVDNGRCDGYDSANDDRS